LPTTLCVQVDFKVEVAAGAVVIPSEAVVAATGAVDVGAFNLRGGCVRHHCKTRTPNRFCLRRIHAFAPSIRTAQDSSARSCITQHQKALAAAKCCSNQRENQ
jgi:hypothetical protein